MAWLFEPNLEPDLRSQISDLRFKISTKPMSQRIPKILIISSDTGGGHRSAAAAIVAGVQKFLEGESYAVRVVKAIEQSHHLTAKLVRLYNWILGNRQHWLKQFYWDCNHSVPG